LCVLLTNINSGTGIREWKKAPEQPAPRVSYLSTLSCANFIVAIQSVPAFKTADGLARSIADLNMDGPTIAKMCDADQKAFFVGLCGLTEMHSIVLIAKIKSWHEQLV
jgi:hypothetical protein